MPLCRRAARAQSTAPKVKSVSAAARLSATVYLRLRPFQQPRSAHSPEIDFPLSYTCQRRETLRKNMRTEILVSRILSFIHAGGLWKFLRLPGDSPKGHRFIWD